MDAMSMRRTEGRGKLFGSILDTVGATPPCGSTPSRRRVRRLPDTGERYMFTPLFEMIPEDMTGEEVKLSRSTPGYQIG